MELRAIIVDDEDLARKNLAIMLENYCPEIDVIGEAGDIDEAESIIKSAQPDVVFLDIRMPSGSEGFDLLERLENRNFLVVFVTAFKDYAIRAFQTNAVHYILRSEEHTSELQSRPHLVCRLLLEKKKNTNTL